MTQSTEQALQQRIAARIAQRTPYEPRPTPKFDPMLRQVAFGAMVALTLSGCVSRTADGASDALDPALYVDSETGCNYLSTGSYHALTARIAADGHSHMGCKGGAK